MKIAITGGAGFLGYHICNYLGDKCDEIRVIDIAPLNTEKYPENTTYFNLDVRDKTRLLRALDGVEMIVHGAAALPLWKKRDIFTTNIDGTKNVLEAGLKNGVKRVVYISSTAVYGVPEKHPIYEDDPLIGVGPYGETKIIAERICEEYRNKGLIVPIIRPKTFIGTGRMGVFQILYDWIESGKKIPIIGNGKNRYQLLEVEDLANAIYLTLTLPSEKVNDTFNIGAKDYGTVLEDVGTLCKFARNGARVMTTPARIVKPMLEIAWALRLSPLYKWVYGTADTDSFVSVEKAEKILGWEPKYSNAEALIRSYKWYLEHKNELKAVGITHRVAWKQGILGLIKQLI
ncbi:MAG TPA: NAD(P)-dependent oxidoreductase [candidate division WOR-3 bacterium]|uniref:NAD(P)-dependent oxidoreductase n=1 Tax=candidate division WOR-3 bacterium TaxID=2052148 RepID=A0A7C5HFJ5_UNCW3|nr:NAD(P)-dependent oxidoreductase [candidate division WOR-3 bacterium]